MALLESLQKYFGARITLLGGFFENVQLYKNNSYFSF